MVFHDTNVFQDPSKKIDVFYGWYQLMTKSLSKIDLDTIVSLKRHFYLYKILDVMGYTIGNRPTPKTRGFYTVHVDSTT